MSHGQSQLERGFSQNKEILQDNLQEMSLVSPSILQNKNCMVFAISPVLYRSCKSAYSNYKIALDTAKEDKEKTKSR